MLGVLKNFDLPSELYADDVRDIVGSCIERFGIREWKLVVMTNEIHGHLGIYSTLGAKMGLLARELFERQGITDHISILSYAGSVPPVSCLNDGLQISTGATVGHGLINVAEDPHKRVEAVFTAGEKSIRLYLRPEYEARIRQDISLGLEKYGTGAQYWQYVRELALKYWCGWDRNELFFVFRVDANGDGSVVDQGNLHVGAELSSACGAADCD